MVWADIFDFHLWWIFPLVMMALCFLMMRGRGGMRMCGFGSSTDAGESAMDILDKRYARGEIDQREYDERKGKLMQTKRGA